METALEDCTFSEGQGRVANQHEVLHSHAGNKSIGIIVLARYTAADFSVKKIIGKDFMMLTACTAALFSMVTGVI